MIGFSPLSNGSNSVTSVMQLLMRRCDCVATVSGRNHPGQLYIMDILLNVFNICSLHLKYLNTFIEKNGNV